MSIHFSKYGLNTYQGTDYFRAHVPPTYPLSLVLQACRAFNKLPPNLHELATKAKQWARANNQKISGIRRYYSESGQELDDETGQPLTEAENNAQWGPEDPALAQYKTMDIPKPQGGFPDPLTWEPPAQAPSSIAPVGNKPTEAQLRSWVESHGAERVSRDFGIPISQLPKVDRPAFTHVKLEEGEEIVGIATGELYTGPQVPKKKG